MVQELWESHHVSLGDMMLGYVNIFSKEQECAKLDELFKTLEQDKKIGCWMNLNFIDKISDYANTLCARDWRGFGRGFGVMTGVIEVEDDGDT